MSEQIGENSCQIQCYTYCIISNEYNCKIEYTFFRIVTLFGCLFLLYFLFILFAAADDSTRALLRAIFDLIITYPTNIFQNIVIKCALFFWWPVSWCVICLWCIFVLDAKNMAYAHFHIRTVFNLIFYIWIFAIVYSRLLLLYYYIPFIPGDDSPQAKLTKSVFVWFSIVLQLPSNTRLVENRGIEKVCSYSQKKWKCKSNK